MAMIRRNERLREAATFLSCLRASGFSWLIFSKFTCFQVFRTLLTFSLEFHSISLSSCRPVFVLSEPLSLINPAT